MSNAAFIVAALVALAMAVRRDRLDGPVAWLIGAVFVVGTGSFLFHTFATVWAAMADTGPIMVFILSYFTIAMRCFGGYGWWRSAALTAAFLLAMVAMSYVLNQVLRPLIGGSVSYVPALVALFAVGLWLSLRSHPAGAWLIAVSGIFAVSLTARALDLPLCDSLSVGTHWLWHTLNGVVLGTLTVAVIRHGRQRPAAEKLAPEKS